MHHRPMRASTIRADALYSVVRRALGHWRAVILFTALVTWSGPALWAATVSTHAFGRWEMVIQEGAPFATSEFLGAVRRQSGLPEYPLMLRAQKGLLELGILGPGSRPIPLAAAKPTWPAGRPVTTARFVVERSTREEERLTLWLRRASAPGRVSLSVDLRSLERMLEGER